MKIRKEILENLKEIKKIRRKLHMNPEIGFNTRNTLKLIIDYVGIKPYISDDISGVFYLPSKGECIAFRCELDALNIKEINDVEYKSKNNYMHACGHDMHMAIMITLIKYFLKHDHYYSLAFIFQPAEESGAGALHMINQNIFKSIKIKELYAFHVYPNLSNFIGCREGIIMSQSCEMDIVIHGKGGHLNNEYSIDSIKTMNEFMNKFYELQKELKPNLIHIGKIDAGDIRNSISNKSCLYGTIRCFNTNYMDDIKETLKKYLIQLDAEYHTLSTIQYSIGYPPIINSSKLVEKVKKHTQNYLEIEPMILSDDFSYYQDYCEICYIFCGLTTTNELHSNNFDLKEEDCLKILELFIRIIEDVFIN